MGWWYTTLFCPKGRGSVEWEGVVDLRNTLSNTEMIAPATGPLQDCKQGAKHTVSIFDSTGVIASVVCVG